jgi:hypothetical protein
VKRPIARERWPWDQVQLEIHEVSAIKAIPQAAFDAILKVAGIDQMSFASGGEEGRRATDFAEGKRWVGATLRTIRNMKMPGPKPTETGPHAVPKGAPPGES